MNSREPIGVVKQFLVYNVVPLDTSYVISVLLLQSFLLMGVDISLPLQKLSGYLVACPVNRDLTGRASVTDVSSLHLCVRTDTNPSRTGAD